MSIPGVSGALQRISRVLSFGAIQGVSKRFKAFQRDAMVFQEVSEHSRGVSGFQGVSRMFQGIAESFRRVKDDPFHGNPLECP